MEESLRRAVRARAGGVCEYCHLPQAYVLLWFEVDHIIALQHRGQTVLENLALACGHCNKQKGPNIAGLDPLSGQLTPLFHPRRDYWAGHFEWNGPELVGRTAIGRTTIPVLDVNDPDEVMRRSALMEEGVFPLGAPPEPP